MWIFPDLILHKLHDSGLHNFWQDFLSFLDSVKSGHILTTDYFKSGIVTITTSYFFNETLVIFQLLMIDNTNSSFSIFLIAVESNLSNGVLFNKRSLRLQLLVKWSPLSPTFQQRKVIMKPWQPLSTTITINGFQISNIHEHTYIICCRF